MGRVGADGTTIGAELPSAATPITRADRRWYMETWADQIREEGQDVDVVSIIDHHGADVTWPDAKPPFNGVVFVARTDDVGLQWLERYGFE